MTQFIDYFNYLWETIMANVSGVYNYFTEPNDLKSDLKTNIKNKVIQMEKLDIENRHR